MQASSASPFNRAMHRLKGKDLLLVQNALERARRAHSGQTRKDGSPYIDHPIAVAVILADWGADAETIAAGLLHDVIEDTDITRETIAKEFSETVAELVEGVTKITETDLLARQHEGQETPLTLDRKTETLRKLFDVMREDIRALVIKLADRVHNVRTIERLAPDRRVRFAKETLDIYYKLAYHLGMNDVRREFSERCVPIAHPEAGTQLVTLRARKMAEVRSLLPAMERQLKKEDRSGAIAELRLEGHSLVSLLHDRVQPDFTEDQTVYLVVIANDEEGCYTALKNLHALYHPRSAQFRDYIATPARSGYRSLHTTVSDESGHIFDMRIRTAAMDQEERAGILRSCFGKSWKGKEFEWLQRSAAFDWATREDSTAFLQALQNDILQESITVVADGSEVQVASNATVLDVVYARYGKRGHHVTVVHRNGAIAFLGDIVREDDVIVATLASKEHVRFEWLGFATTAYARALIVEALKKRSREEKLAIGRDLLQKDFDHYRKGFMGDMSRAQQEHITQHFDRPRLEDIFVMIGEGVLSPHDVILALMMEKESSGGTERRKEKPKRFQLQVSGANIGQQEILPRLANVAEQSHVDIRETHLRFNERTGSYSAVVSGRATQKQLADFLSSLDRAEWTSNVYMMLSSVQRLLLGLILATAAAVVVGDVLLFPVYGDLLAKGGWSWILLEILPLLPILGVNYYLLKILRQYSVRLRKDRWFLGIGFVLNIFGVLLMLWKLPVLHGKAQIYPLLFIFTISMLFLSYKYAQSFFAMDRNAEPFSAPNNGPWKTRKHQKMIGYLLRFSAVLIWGLEPVLIRYTSLQELSPMLRVNLWAIIGTICGYFAITLMNVFKKPEHKLRYATPYNKYFWIIVAANISYNYFLHASLLFTTATNVNLVLGYAPIFSLLLGAVIWRDRIPYFRTAKAMQQMVLVFCLSAIGGSLLFLNDVQRTEGGVVGDMLALLIAFSDVVFMMANIYYVKYSKALTNTLALTTQHLLWIGIFTTIIIQLLNLSGQTAIVYTGLTEQQWVASLALGAVTMLGFVLTFEAFKRIDGLLAFLMLNMAPVIAFIPEFLFFGVDVTPFFIAGAVLIACASIGAEIVNTRSEKKDM